MKVLVLQPLPQLCWADAAGYSEFPSLGIARMAADLARYGVETEARYPRCAADMQEAAQASADVIVIGDFRYYAYFANPLPLIRRAIELLTATETTSRLLVAGRHASHFTALGHGIAVQGSYTALADVLTRGAWSASAAAVHGGTALDSSDPLPGPGIPDTTILEDGGELAGSFSRPGLRLAQLMLTKGCPFGCRFCEKAASPVESLTPEQLDQALGALEAAGFQRVAFWDEVFAWPVRSTRDHLAVLAGHGITFNCNCRLSMLREPFVRVLADAGCTEILFGLEVSPGEADASDLLGLDRGKRVAPSLLRDRISLLLDYGIKSVGSVIVGLPADDKDAIERRLEIIDKLGLSYCYVRPLVPFPETVLYSALHGSGAVPDYDSWGPELDTFPHGYATVSSLDRAVLSAFCGR
ncbi:MAG: radical protein [Actinomycetia bacterium]|nr:radical protein [Actinomycetes bacterium]